MVSGEFLLTYVGKKKHCLFFLRTIKALGTSKALEELYKIFRNSGKIPLFAPLCTIKQSVFSDRERLKNTRNGGGAPQSMLLEL